MNERKSARVVYRNTLTPRLEVFRIIPEAGNLFPDYSAGQYIELSRENCKLTRKIQDTDGRTQYVYDRDESGQIRIGRVSRTYSISSAPAETRKGNYLEFFVALEAIESELPGSPTESIFHLDPENGYRLEYLEKIGGNFTLEDRAKGFSNVVMVGSGTGIAPLVSMLKQLHYDALEGKRHPARYTLFYVNRTVSELGYHRELLAIEADQQFDFVYVPSVSRPTPADQSNPILGKGRANTLLRMIFDMPLDGEDQTNMEGNSSDAASDRKLVEPVLPQRHPREAILERMDASRTVVLACGNDELLADVESIARAQGIRFEKEEW